jgi:hypothetical protein
MGMIRVEACAKDKNDENVSRKLRMIFKVQGVQFWMIHTIPRDYLNKLPLEF